MHTKKLIQCGALLAALAPFCAQATPLGAKPGAWETIAVTTIKGLPQGSIPKLSKEQLAKLPPERRAMMERMMAASEGKPVRTTNKSCMKSSDTLDKLLSDNPNRPNCKKKIISQTATSVELEVTCTGAHPTKAHVKLEARTPSEIVSTAKVDGEKGFKVRATTTSRWLGSSCAGITQR